MLFMSSSQSAEDRHDDVACLEQYPRLAILISGGLDSAILLGEALGRGARVNPIYVRAGHPWESIEQLFLDEFLRRLKSSNLEPLTTLAMPVDDLYGDHWSLTGRQVPDERSPDEAVYLPGRNVLLLAKAIVWCHLHGVPAVALAVLKGNPFPDATNQFFSQFQQAVNRAVDGNVAVLRPYGRLHKAEVMARGRALPLEWSLSCINPIGNRHCGRCNKCAERRAAFRKAGMSDPTVYEVEDTCTA